jgi:hypothetical protein
VGPGQLGVGQLVEVGAEPLGQAARVGEHDRGAVGPDQLDQPLVDVGPDRGAVGQAGGRPAGRVVGGLADGRHVLDRHHHRQVEGLLARGGHDRDRAGAAEEARHLVQGPHGGRQADAAGRALQQLVEALQAEGQMRPALGRDHRVDLVDDHRVDVGQGLAGPGGEQQEQRLGGGDEDVGRVGREAPAGLGRGVAGAHPGGDVGQGQVLAGRGRPQPGQGRPEVALDVGGQGLERGDVEDPEPFPLGHRRGGGQPVDGRQERGQGLARPGGRDHQHVLLGGEGVPGAHLGLGGRGEGALEPAAGQGGEPPQPGRGRGRGRRAGGPGCLVHPAMVGPSPDSGPQLDRRLASSNGVRSKISRSWTILPPRTVNRSALGASATRVVCGL